MKIDRRLNGHDLLSDDFFIAEPESCGKNSHRQTPAHRRGLCETLGETAFALLPQGQSVCVTALTRKKLSEKSMIYHRVKAIVCVTTQNPIGNKLHLRFIKSHRK